MTTPGATRAAVDTRTYIGAGRTAIPDEIAHLLTLAEARTGA